MITNHQLFKNMKALIMDQEQKLGRKAKTYNFAVC